MEAFPVHLRKVPPEVWNMIFSNLDNPKDLLSVIRVCTAWEDVLKSRKMEILFMNVFPDVIKYLKGDDVLVCRRVCNQLQIKIDKLVEDSISPLLNHSLEYNWHHQIPVDLNMMFGLLMKYCLFLTSNEKYDREQPFMEKMKRHQGNPFIGSVLQLQFSAGSFEEVNERGQRYHKPGLGILKRFGHHLKTFIHQIPQVDQIVQRNEESFVLRAFSRLPEILKSICNVQFFILVWDVVTCIGNVECEVGARDKCSDFLRYITLPPMRNLNSFTYAYREGYSVSLGIHLLNAYGKQLHTFSCYGKFLERVHPQIINSLLSNLKNLRVLEISAVCMIILSQVNLRLEQLQLDDCNSRFTGRELMTMLNNFSDCLELLFIDKEFPVTRSFGQFVEFKKLKRISSHPKNINRTLFFKMVEKCRSVELLDFLHHDIGTYCCITRKNKLMQRLFNALPELKKVRIYMDFVTLHNPVIISR